MNTDDPKPLPRDRRDAYPPLADDAMASIFDAVADQTVDADPTLRDRARELPTPARATVAVGAAVMACLAFVTLQGWRSDLGSIDVARFAVTSVVLVLIGASASAVTLRGLHRGPMKAAPYLVVTLLGLPALVSMIPGAFEGVPDAVPAIAHVTCGAGSLVAAMISALALLFFDREDRPTLLRIGSAAAAGGVFGFVAQLSHCHMVHPMHLLIGHASAGVLVGALLVVVERFRSR